jgi:hypothetical protein
MILYNVTINVLENIHEEWLKWMKEIHIPRIINTKCFRESKIYRVLSPEPEEGVSYSVQYYTNSIEEFERFQIEHAAIIHTEHTEKYGGKFTIFRSVMEKV